MGSLGRARLIVPTLMAMFSLFVSAVSACACSHHETVKAEAESCHSSSHEAPPAEAIVSNHVETDCGCLVRTPVPAIVAKKDDKRTTVEKQIADVIELTPVFAIEFEVADASDISFEPPISNYHHALLSSLPSRAPPRL